jgi:hypothetical protein
MLDTCVSVSVSMIDFPYVSFSSHKYRTEWLLGLLFTVDILELLFFKCRNHDEAK